MIRSILKSILSVCSTTLDCSALCNMLGVTVLGSIPATDRTPASCRTSVQCLLQKVWLSRSDFRKWGSGSVYMPTASKLKPLANLSAHIAYAFEYAALSALSVTRVYPGFLNPLVRQYTFSPL